ncbi:bifunctional helix-turn-helix transcriptional regulator/GNAT family N-acetyltransferase [Hyphomonas atlantica]|uniref:bifunctional helix-turn-helix transcriptional regulator/GNAT family N-acetyltransferase n=1 Tax=Hyphomonas atlantica TaxID=1280948 RepID=UPI0032B1F72A
MSQDILEQVGYLGLASRLKRLADRLQAEAVSVFDNRAYPIQTTHFPLIAALEASGPLSVSAAVEATGVSQPAITRIHNALQGMGLTDTRAVEGDNRQKEIFLTPAGQALIAEMRASFWPAVRDAAQQLCAFPDHDLLAEISLVESRLAEHPLSARIEHVANPAGLENVEFTDDLAPHFDRISREWVEEMFRLEAEDIAMIENPRAKVIDKGGTILFVRDPELGIIGTCALMPMEDGGVELTKMGVLSSARGRRAGDFLMRQILKRAREMKVQDLFLLTNSKCEAAIRLYEKYGFRHDAEIMRRYGHRYERCDVTMSYAMPTPN